MPLTIQCIAALVEIFAEERLFCCAFLCRNAGRKSNDLDFRRLVLVWSLKLLQAFGGFTSSSLAIYNPKIRNFFAIPHLAFKIVFAVLTTSAILGSKLP